MKSLFSPTYEISSDEDRNRYTVKVDFKNAEDWNRTIESIKRLEADFFEATSYLAWIANYIVAPGVAAFGVIVLLLYLFGETYEDFLIDDYWFGGDRIEQIYGETRDGRDGETRLWLEEEAS